MKGEIYYVHQLEDSICISCQFFPIGLEIQCKSIKIPAGFFFFLVEIDNLVLKFIWKSKKPNRARVILTKRAKLEESYYVISELIKIDKYSVVLT